MVKLIQKRKIHTGTVCTGMQNKCNVTTASKTDRTVCTGLQAQCNATGVTRPVSVSGILNNNKTKKQKYNLHYINPKLNTKVDVNTKFIVINSIQGFGNKIYDMLISLYLKYILGYKIYCNEKKSIHNLSNDPILLDIIPNIKNEINFIDDAEDNYLANKFNIKSTNYILSNNDKFGLDKLQEAIKKLNYTHMYIKPFRFYNYIYELYILIRHLNLKKIFQINTQYISKQTLELAKTKYSAIHIRYGDKLKLALSSKYNKLDRIFYLLSPLYYKLIIDKLKKYNLPIYIFTDSPKLVKHFILDKYNISTSLEQTIQILPTTFLDTFYLQYHATYFAGSISTMSYSAFIFSKIFNTGQTYLNYSITDIDEANYGTDYINLSKYMKQNIINIKHNKKYILNYDKTLLIKMNKYRSH